MARDLWWSWTPEARSVFRGLDYSVWRQTAHNPVRMLQILTPDVYERAIADVTFACGAGGGQLQGVEFVVVVGAQVDRVALPPALGQTQDAHEEIEALLRLVGQQFDMAEMGNIENGFGILHG